MGDPDTTTSIWRKEISFRRKPKERAVPPLPPAPARADSVSELLRPLAPDREPRRALPPISPPIASPPPPPMPPEANPFDETAQDKPQRQDPPPGPEPHPAFALAPPPLGQPPPLAPRAQAAASTAPARWPVRRLERPVPAAEERRRREKPYRSRRRPFQRTPKPEPERSLRQPRTKRPRGGPKTHARLVGLKIGASQITAARVVNKKGEPHVLQLAREPLARGVVVAGDLREPEELASALRAFFRRHKLPRSGVRLGLANNRIGVRIFEISGIDDPRQLANAIRFRAQEALPIPLDQAVLDYRILREEPGPDGVLTRRILLVVAHRELVERYVAACRKAGLKLVGIDLEAFALLRALAEPSEPVRRAAEDAAVVVVSIGHDRSTLAVSDGSVCEFTRVLEWGGSVLDAAVARALDLTAAEAEPIKRALSIRDGDAGERAGLSEDDAARARAAMLVELQAFARDLVASLRFYQGQPGSLGIAEVILTGGGSELEGIDAELERLIGVTVRLGDPLARVRVGRRIKKQAVAGSLTAAIGLGIED